MKYKNKQRKLQARIKEWETIKADDTKDGGKTKIIAGAAFRKPGSNKK